MSSGQKKNVAWANTIKNHHNKVRTAVTAPGVGIEDTIDDSYMRWRQQRDSSANDLKEYATAMHDLGTLFWGKGGGVGVLNETQRTGLGEKRLRESALDESQQPTSEKNDEAASLAQEEFSTTTGRYDDRVAIVVDAVKEFFFGTVSSSSESEKSKLPVIITKELRNPRKAHFETHGKQLPVEEETKLVKALLAEGGPCIKALVAPHSRRRMNLHKQALHS